LREQGLIVPNSGGDTVTAGAMLLFGKRTQDFFPHAVVSLTESGKKMIALKRASEALW
jgi:hypothetical protein